MKKRIIIIESSVQQAFTTAQIVVAKFKLETQSENPATFNDAICVAESFGANEFYTRPNGSIQSLIEYLTRKGANRRNTEVLVMCAENLTGFNPESRHTNK